MIEVKGGKGSVFSFSCEQAVTNRLSRSKDPTVIKLFFMLFILFDHRERLRLPYFFEPLLPKLSRIGQSGLWSPAHALIKCDNVSLMVFSLAIFD